MPRERRPAAAATARVDAALQAAARALHATALPTGARVLLGLSGGQDSLALAHALSRLRDSHGWDLHAAYVDHAIRDAGAAEATWLAGVCARLAIPFVARRVDVPAFRARTRLNLQATARYARYQTLARAAAACGAGGVMVAHTADDLAETLLLHLLRGAGLDGLSGMPLVQTLTAAALGPPLDPQASPLPLTLVRPLLQVSRADTGAYCAEHGLEPLREPPARYRRNQLREELLPRLERYNPRVREALAGAARALAEDRALVEQVVEAWWQRVSSRDGRAIVLAWEADVPVAVPRRLLRRAVRELVGSEANLSRRTLDAALRVAAGPSGRGLDLPHGVRLERESGVLRLARRPTSEAPGPGEWCLGAPGSLELPGVGWLHVDLTELPTDWRDAPPNACWLAAATVRFPLRVRFRRAGDRFQPLGLAQPKRLQDFLVDAQVPRHRRATLPLVVADNAIVWVVGYRIAHWARIQADTQAALHVRFQPAAGDQPAQPEPPESAC